MSTLNTLTCRLAAAEKRTDELQDNLIETSKTETGKKKSNK